MMTATTTPLPPGRTNDDENDKDVMIQPPPPPPPPPTIPQSPSRTNPPTAPPTISSTLPLPSSSSSSEWVADWSEWNASFRENVAEPTRNAVRNFFYTTETATTMTNSASPSPSASVKRFQQRRCVNFSLDENDENERERRGRRRSNLFEEGEGKGKGGRGSASAAAAESSVVGGFETGGGEIFTFDDDNNNNNNSNNNNSSILSPTTTTPISAEEQQQLNSIVESFWKTYDDFVILSLGALLGILARLGAASFFTYVGGAVFMEGSALFTNLPLNCLSAFLMGCFESGENCLKIVYTRWNEPRHSPTHAANAAESETYDYDSDYDDCEYDYDYDNDYNNDEMMSGRDKTLRRRRDRRTTKQQQERQQRRRRKKQERWKRRRRKHFKMYSEEEFRMVQLEALERRIRDSPSLLLFPAKREQDDLVEHVGNLRGFDEVEEEEKKRQEKSLMEDKYHDYNDDYDEDDDDSYGSTGKDARQTIKGMRLRSAATTTPRRRNIHRNGEFHGGGENGPLENASADNDNKNSPLPCDHHGGDVGAGGGHCCNDDDDTQNGMKTIRIPPRGGGDSGTTTNTLSSAVAEEASSSLSPPRRDAILTGEDSFGEDRRSVVVRKEVDEEDGQRMKDMEEGNSGGGGDDDGEEENSSSRGVFRRGVVGGGRRRRRRLRNGHSVLSQDEDDDEDGDDNNNNKNENGHVDDDDEHLESNGVMVVSSPLASSSSSTPSYSGGGKEIDDGNCTSATASPSPEQQCRRDASASFPSSEAAAAAASGNNVSGGDGVGGAGGGDVDLFNLRYLTRLRIAEGWDVGTTAEAMCDDLLLGLRVGFCGALSSFSSWNSSMVDLLRNGKIGPAIVGYLIGLEMPIIAYRTGQHLAVYAFIWKCRRETAKDERRGYGLRLGEEEDEKNRDGDSAANSEAARILDEDATEREVPSVRAILTAIFILALVFIFTSLHVFPAPSQQLLAMSLLFTPLGVLGRWKILELNALKPNFPLGTFACNMLGCALSGSLGGFLAGNPGPEERVVLVGVISGFGGSLSSLTAFLVEVLERMDPIIMKYDGIVYACATILWAVMIGFITSQSKDWADRMERDL